MIRTHTRTHVYTSLANPYLRCEQCGGWVTGRHNPDKCGCDTYTVNVPCCCRSGSESACLTWSPVDGCTCRDVFGTVEHGEPPAKETL